MDSKNLINWGELSRYLSGARDTVRKNRIPAKHKLFIDELLKSIDKAVLKHEQTKQTNQAE
jgi:hypothetical protein